VWRRNYDNTCMLSSFDMISDRRTDRIPISILRVLSRDKSLKTGINPYSLLTLSDPGGGVLALIDPRGLTSGGIFSRG